VRDVDPLRQQGLAFALEQRVGHAPPRALPESFPLVRGIDAYECRDALVSVAFPTWFFVNLGGGWERRSGLMVSGMT
jgi:hypothetical protein